MEGAASEVSSGRGWSLKLAIGLVIAAVLLAGGLSLFASAYPDGLEWSIGKVAGDEPAHSGIAYRIADWIQSKTALMPDYSTGAASEAASTSGAGLIGGGIVLALAAGTAFLLSRVKRKTAEQQDAE